MNARFRSTRGKVAAAVGLVAIAASVSVGFSAMAGEGSTKSEHWGVIDRNTIGSAVGELRDGPYGSFSVSGPSAAPPFGKGSVALRVSDNATTLTPPSEKVDFGNEVDFKGDPVLAIDQVGFHVFNTGENGAGNMPNIRSEIDANLNTLPADNFTTMVWVPDPSPVVDQWSGYIDATTTGKWYFTGAEGVATGCNQTTMCTFAAAKTALNDGGDAPIMYTLMVGKGRDSRWSGAVDGLRLNKKQYDFEVDGVKAKDAK